MTISSAPAARRTCQHFTALAVVALTLTLSAAAEPRRIISMSPSVTETVYLLGLGSKLVGVTRYCDYPEAAKELPKVGGYVDPNYEVIVALRPDLVILLTSHDAAARELKQLGIATLTTPHRTVEDVHEMIRLIGEACGAQEEAAAVLGTLEKRTESVRETVKDRPRPRVLVCIGRETESGRLAGMYVAANDGFYDKIVEMAGGVVACRNGSVPYPQVSVEGVIQLNPDVIVDLVSRIEPDGRSIEELARHWDQLRVVKAVRNGEVHVVAGDHALRPGPRYIQFLEELARLLHPEAFRKKNGRE